MTRAANGVPVAAGQTIQAARRLDRAIDFELPDQDGRPWRLSTALAAGPVAVVFYRGDWCPYCNGQLLSYARGWGRFEDAGLQLVAIAVDSIDQNRAMVDKLILPFPVLSDPETRVISDWAVLNEEEGRIARPAMFLIREDLSIMLAHVGEDFDDRPDDDALFEALS